MASNKTFIVAEMSANHCQVFQKAVALIQAAKRCNADAVKIQMFDPEQMASKDEKSVIKEGLWKGYTLYEIYRQAFMPYEWVPRLIEVAEEEDIELFTTVYHPDTVRLTEALEFKRYKIASFEIPYIELIERVALTKKPVIISTGMADFREIEAAVKIIKKVHNNIILLKCTSSYPAQLKDLNLKTIPAMSHAFKVPVGFSDHTTGITAAIVAVSLGATVIEKHLALDKESLDGEFSAMPETFAAMVHRIRAAEKSFGEVTYGGIKKFRRQKVEGRWIRTIR